MNVEDPKYVYPAKPLYLPPDASLLDELNNDNEWIAEVKKNGWRCMVRKVDDQVSLWTRHRTLITDDLPELRQQLAELDLPDDTILDGELLEHRSTTKQSIMLWGIIRWSGKWYDNRPYQEIRDKVKDLLPNSGKLLFPEFTFKNKKKFYEKVIQDNIENEGIVLKRMSKAVPFFHNTSKKINHWLKVKPVE